MGANVASFVLDRLNGWGVDRVYGYPGEGINGFLGAFHEHGEGIEFVQARHEELAAFMACGHAKLTGEVGVCMATSGAGAIHLLNGLYDAKLDRQPVLAIVGQATTISLGGSFQQEVDLASLFKDVAGEYVQVLMNPAQTRHLVDRAYRIAAASRTVTCLIVPADVQEEEHEDPPRAHGAVFTGGSVSVPLAVPREDDLRRAAEALNGSQRVAMLIGQGARHAAEEVATAAEALGCGVAKALNGRDVLPDDLPFVTGSIGLLGTKPSHDMMMGCDALLMVGSSFPYSEWLPEEGQARGVQIDLDPRVVGMRYPMEVNLVGDSKETLRALLAHLEPKADRSWRAEIEQAVERWWRVVEEQAMLDADPLNPQRVVWELNSQLPDGAIVTADSGSGTNWWARQLRLRDGMRAALSGTLATMGGATPYAVAAKFAHPDRPVIAVAGDGAMQMNGINALIDAARYYPRWSDPRLVVLVLNNGDLNQVTWEQRVMAGDPKLDASQDLPEFGYARYAELLRLKGIRVDAPDDVRGAWQEALAADRPVVLEAIVDPEVPPLPPHIRFEQAKSLAEALAKGDPHGVGVLRHSLKGKLQEFVKR